MELTPREKEVLKLAANGRSCKQIAQDLGISPYTVKSHRENMHKKLGIRGSSTALIAYAHQNGLA